MEGAFINKGGNMLTATGLGFELVSSSETYVDEFNLDRYIMAQDKDDIYNKILKAIRQGNQKPQPSSTWMWCIFPQMDHCNTTIHHPKKPDRWPKGHAMASLDEARAILRHPVLGPRIREAAQALLDSPQVDKFTVMDNMYLDVARLHSSLTIFRQAGRYPVCIHNKAKRMGENYVFREVLDKYFPNEPDSEDDDYNSADEDHEGAWKGTRHGPTLKRLDELEMEAAKERLSWSPKSSKARCSCGVTDARTHASDRRTREKIQEKTILDAVKNLKRYIYIPSFARPAIQSRVLRTNITIQSIESEGVKSTRRGRKSAVFTWTGRPKVPERQTSR